MNISAANTIDTVKAMLRQEAEYAVTELEYPEDPSGIDSNARDKMVEWCCRVVGHCQLQTETVCISMNYTDRICMRDPSILTSHTVYQLVAMTALYTAAKIHAPEAMDPKLVSQLSRGTYTAEEIEEQERRLVSALQWRLNPPTAHSFVRQYLELFNSPGVLSVNQREAVVQCALQQIDAFAFKQRCSTVVPESVIAYCAVVNALKYLPNLYLSEKRVASMDHRLAQLIGLYPSTAVEVMLSEAQFILLQSIQEQQSQQCLSISSRQNKRVRICPQHATGVPTISTARSNYSPTLISERCISHANTSR
jgi:hypothetical protein